MKDNIPVFLDRVKIIIDEFRRSGSRTVLTSDILGKYSGGFYSNIKIPPAYSFNALFGKVLKRNEKFLSIEEDESDVPINDDLGRQTSTSRWVLK